MANNSINLTSLDFDTLKSTLKTYLKSQSQFADYNFDGSNMSVLLDILTYNTHLNSFYLNMVASEMFLDSAQLRSSVISKAKELNYTPQSYKSSVAALTLSFPQSSLSVFTIPSGTSFTGQNANGTFSFISNSALTMYPSGGSFVANNFLIYEGKKFTDTFVVDTTLENQRFVLSNDSIDTDSIVVALIENNSSNTSIFTKATNLYGLNSNSAVYFVQSCQDTKYEVLFGDGVFGRYPMNNSVVFVNYRVTSGSDGNATTNFNLDNNLGPVNGLVSFINPSVAVISAGSGGANAESTESIRFNAPRHYQTQDRAITANDFKTMILQEYTDVKSVHVFGGELVADSVQFGKVFVSPVTYSGFSLSLTEKADIESFLSNKCTLGIKPKVVDPDFLYLIVNTTVKYNQNDTTLTANDIENIASIAIQAYNTSYLIDFNTEFKMSRLEAAINDAHASISSNETEIVLRKDVNPELNTDVYIDISYRNQITPGSFYSTTFISGGNQYTYTDFNPNINTLSVTQNVNGGVTITNSTTTVYLKNISTPGYESYTSAGTIDYNTGSIQLTKININGFVNESSIKFYATPAFQNVSSSQNDVIEIDIIEGINITVKSI